MLFFHILGIIILTDFHIFQRGRYTTNQKIRKLSSIKTLGTEPSKKKTRTCLTMKKNGWFQHQRLEISPRQIWILATHGFIWSFGLFLGNSFYFFCREANFLMLHVLLKLVRSSRKIDSCVFSNTFAPFLGVIWQWMLNQSIASRDRQLWTPIAFSRLLEIGKPNCSQIMMKLVGGWLAFDP